MTKDDAIQLLGGTVTSLAREIGISPQAVTQWPAELPARLSDRVVAAYVRREAPELARDICSAMKSAKEVGHA